LYFGESPQIYFFAFQYLTDGQSKNENPFNLMSVNSESVSNRINDSDLQYEKHSENDQELGLMRSALSQTHKGRFGQRMALRAARDRESTRER
jgi:hypothetical protein